MAHLLMDCTLEHRNTSDHSRNKIDVHNHHLSRSLVLIGRTSRGNTLRLSSTNDRTTDIAPLSVVLDLLSYRSWIFYTTTVSYPHTRTVSKKKVQSFHTP